jgi:hypothetical protein
MNIRDDTVPTIHLGIGYETFGSSHSHLITLALFKALVGEWSASDFSGISLRFFAIS